MGQKQDFSYDSDHSSDTVSNDAADNERWTAIGDLVAAILHEMYCKHPKRVRHVASKRGIAVEQLAAAAIAGAVREQLEGA